jgi:uncharacterized protein YcfJ
MKKSFSLVLGAFVSLSAFAASNEDYARVISVQERFSQGTSRKVCANEPVANDGNSYGAGTAIGAIAGGLLGSQVGKGNGKVAAAAGGAVVGALSGNYLENRNGSTEPRCRYVETAGRPAGYLVTYEYAGRQYTDTFTYPPEGDSVRVRVTVMPLPSLR